MSNRLPTPWQGTLTAFTGLVLLITLGMVVQWWSVYAGLLLTEFGLLLGPALFLASRWDLDLVASFRAGRGTLPGLPGTVAAGACIGVMAFVMALGLTLPFLFFVMLTGGHYPGLPLSLSAPHEYVLAMLAGAVAAPICEEAVFRGFLLGSLRRHGVHLAVWVSAACFGIFHLDPIRFIPTMALGVVYGYLTLSTGSIRPSMVAHGVNNGMALSLAYMAGPEGRSGADLTYPAIKEEILRNISAAHLSLGGLSEDVVVCLALALAAAMLLGFGMVMAALIGLLLWRLRKGMKVAFDGEEKLPPVGLVRLPWLWGIGFIGLVFWGLTLWTVYTGQTSPATEKAGTGTAWYLEGGGHKVLIDQRGTDSGRILLTQSIRTDQADRSDDSSGGCFDSFQAGG